MYDSFEIRKSGRLVSKHLFKDAGIPCQFLLSSVNSGQQGEEKEKFQEDNSE